MSKPTIGPISKLGPKTFGSGGGSRLGLRELREAAGLTQVELAARLNKAQGEVSKLERREDFYLSTLRDYVRALGGEIEVMVRLGGRQFRLSSNSTRKADI